MSEHEVMGYKISLEEAEDGYKVYIKGDKEKLKVKLEAMEAYLNYQEKARAAGMPVGHKMFPGPMMHMMHGHGHGQHGYGMGYGTEKVKRFVGHFSKAMKDAVSEMKEDNKK